MDPESRTSQVRDERVTFGPRQHATLGRCPPFRPRVKLEVQGQQPDMGGRNRTEEQDHGINFERLLAV